MHFWASNCLYKTLEKYLGKSRFHEDKLNFILIIVRKVIICEGVVIQCTIRKKFPFSPSPE